MFLEPEAGYQVAGWKINLMEICIAVCLQFGGNGSEERPKLDKTRIETTIDDKKKDKVSGG